MEQHWGRRHGLIALDEGTLAELLQPIAAGKRVLAAEPLSGGLVNTNYRVTLAGFDRPVVLRLYARDGTACQKDVDLFARLWGRVPMAELLHADAAGERIGRPYAVFAWIEGEPLEGVLLRRDEAETVQAAESIGAALAAIGEVHMPQAGFLGPGLAVAEPFDDFESGFRQFIEQQFEASPGERLGPALAARLRGFVADNAALLAPLGGGYTLVHGDFKGSNILMRRERGVWATAAVLDWEFAWAGTPLSDVGQMIRYDRAFHPAFTPAFARSFAAHGGALPQGWKRTARMLDLFNLLDFLGDTGREEALVGDVVALIDATLQEPLDDV